MDSKRTKQCRAFKWLFKILHFLMLFGPFLYFIPYGFSVGEKAQTVGLTAMMVISSILLILSIVMDVKHRAGLFKATLWILVGGVSLCLTEIESFIWIMITVSVLDELVICPLADHYSTALTANVEIDKRS